NPRCSVDPVRARKRSQVHCARARRQAIRGKSSKKRRSESRQTGIGFVFIQPWFEPSHDANVTAADCRGANGNSDVELVSGCNSKEACSAYSHHLYRVVVQCKDLAYNIWISAEVTLPETIAQNRCSRTIVKVVVSRQYTPKRRSNAQCRKIIAA